MYLLVAATDFELEPARQALAGCRNVAFLTSGVGPVETTFSLTRYLSLHQQISAVINFGAAGAYLDTGIEMLDICLARKELLADFGICFTDRIEPLTGESLIINREFDLENEFFLEAEKILEGESFPLYTGTFLTVNCVSGETTRGNVLRDTYKAICENMEGAAIARVCRGFGLDFLELRCISNMVEDRQPARWRLKEACETAGFAVSRVLQELSGGQLHLKH